MHNPHITELVEAIGRLKKNDIILAFLKNILTPAELDEIATRLQIFKLLKKGVPQREVAEKLGVGIATVSRGARELKYGGPGLKNL
ncbi:helix-turn-helix domain-containing protein [Candidatus Uhrbacteria bacterium]|nr:helix-turn-helix domain-containing protein [Candidatus Uhrbacteria bacterium]